MATHSSTLAWKIPRMEEPGRLQSMGSQRAGHNWATSLHFTSEEIKKNQYIMNNSINEIKNTLEGTNSRITEAEDRISEVEDRKWKWSCSVISDALQPHGLQPPRLLRTWDFPGKSTGVGCHFLLQGTFPTQGSNPGLLHCRQTLYPLSH